MANIERKIHIEAIHSVIGSRGAFALDTSNHMIWAKTEKEIACHVVVAHPVNSAYAIDNPLFTGSISVVER